MVREMGVLACVGVLVWLGGHEALGAAGQGGSPAADGALSDARMGLTWWTVGIVALFLGRRVREAHSLRWTGDQHIATPWLLPAIAGLTGLGVVLQLGFGDPLGPDWRGWTQGVGVGLGGLAGGAWLALRRPEVEVWGAWGVRLAALITVVPLVLLASPAGVDVAGQRIVVSLPGLQVQPLEVAKVGFALWLGLVLAAQGTTLSRHRMTLLGLQVPPLHRLAGALAGLAVLVVLVGGVFRDLGLLLIAGGLFVAMVYLALASRVWMGLGLGALGLAASSLIATPEVLGASFVTRVRMWLDPWTNGLPNGSQLAEAHWAFALGGLTGRGVGAAAAGGLKAGHTDLVLALLGEELGLLGGWLALLLLGVFVQQGLSIALQARSRERAMVTAALTGLLFVQWLVIFGGTVGWLPLTGVVVPFLSFGRSAIAVFVVVGALLLDMAAGGRARTVSDDLANVRRPLQDLSLGVWAVFVLAAFQLARLGVWFPAATLSTPALVTTAEGQPTLLYARALRRLRTALPRSAFLDRDGELLRRGDDDRSDSLATLLGPVPGRVGVRPEAWMLEHRHAERLRGYPALPPLEVVRKDGKTVRLTPLDLSPLIPIARATAAQREVLARRWAVERQAADVRLSVDRPLQERVTEALVAGLNGAPAAAAAVIDVDSGRFLALAQVPHLGQPGAVPGVEGVPAWKNGLYGPWMDKTGDVAGVRAAGSPWKLVTGMARVRAGVDVTGQGVQTNGGPVYRCEGFGGRAGAQLPGWIAPIRDFRGGHLRPFGFVEALQDSRNCWFAQEGVALGPAAYTSLVADGLPVGGGAEWFDPGAAGSRRLGLTGIGQGGAAWNVRQAAQVVAAIGGGGVLVDCPLVMGEACEERVLVDDPEGLRWILAGMRQVMLDGTGRGLRVDTELPGLRVYGKSGTADDGILQPGEVSSGYAPAGRLAPHAWFVMLAEPDEGEVAQAVVPGRIAVAVLVFRGGLGSRAAGPIARKIMAAAQAEGWLGQTVAAVRP